MDQGPGKKQAPESRELWVLRVACQQIKSYIFRVNVSHGGPGFRRPLRCEERPAWDCGRPTFYPGNYKTGDRQGGPYEILRFVQDDPEVQAAISLRS